MIEKMKFLSITGPKADIDRVVNTYLSKYEIHLENALSELTAVESLSPFMEINPYKEAAASVKRNTTHGLYIFTLRQLHENIVHKYISIGVASILIMLTIMLIADGSRKSSIPVTKSV